MHAPQAEWRCRSRHCKNYLEELGVKIPVAVQNASEVDAAMTSPVVAQARPGIVRGKFKKQQLVVVHTEFWNVVAETAVPTFERTFNLASWVPVAMQAFLKMTVPLTSAYDPHERSGRESTCDSASASGYVAAKTCGHVAVAAQENQIRCCPQH